MPQKCSICQHTKRQEIEDAVSGGEALRNIAERFGTSPQAIIRHKPHIVTVVAESTKEVSLPDVPQSTYAQELANMKVKAEQALANAEHAENQQAAILWFRELREIMKMYFQIGVAQMEAQKHLDVSPEIMAMVDEVISEPH